MEVPDELGQFLVRAGKVRQLESDGTPTLHSPTQATVRKQRKSPQGSKRKVTK